MSSRESLEMRVDSLYAAPARPAVLAVDDVEANLVAVQALLEDFDCDVVVAKSGNEALRQLLRRQFAVMLLDVQMPEMDGYEVAAHARKNPQTRDVPIIFLTAGNNNEGNVLRGYGSGAVDFLFKPLNAPIVRSKVRIFLELYAGRQQIAQAKSALERSNAELRELADEKARIADQFKRANEELTIAYEELRTTHAQLVQSAKMASLGELVAGVAHEINNPLAFVLSHLDTTKRSLARVETELNPAENAAAAESWSRAQDRLGEMRVGLDRIRDLVVKLRAFSRLDEGERKRVSLRECVDSVLTILGHRLRRCSVDLELNAPDELDCFPGPLNQALMNLVANSLDAMGDEGKIKISSAVNDRKYEIRIEDSGPGIPKELRERVLEPFFTTKPVGQGTGLGLSITYSIVKKHGGSLDILNGTNRGAIMIIRLPLGGAE
ncbi:MAG TPA: ATP-binding protein [Polyangiaceae bacterium]|jgi:two-component system NtrC family sensor kinase|nr:ATP-binding protein [Polyangiaceae bacterium]